MIDNKKNNLEKIKTYFVRKKIKINVSFAFLK